ncbi:MAG: transcriptional repressor [Alphaproteobacteria bacterium]|nr:transcriptional repressor [Alphaproteobacteria bacterium]MDA7982976.1 transcriptional repressor [Alphaproteobacteria bacterium]MDA7984385.1 transcriptional repressor [Alphaproteobacteria bacterium]MDA7987210.1 transcriptional repressor [Alphaproteobacteria bacterium]MDA8008978.1 transcriptional repressor [Alphaproteobacteria bacterium]
MSEIAENCCHAGSNESVARLLQAAEVACLASGKKLTPLRKNTLAALAASRAPLGAYDLLHRLNENTATPLAPAAVYRALNFWEKLGFAHRIASDKTWMVCTGEAHGDSGTINSESGGEISEGFLICRECGHAHEFSDISLQNRVPEIAAGHRFAFLSARIQIEGLCPSCAATK